jgi:glucose-6-phosphate isomerase
MIDEIRNVGNQFGIAMSVARKIEFGELPQNVENIYLCGMGGSSLPGDIVNTLLRDEVEIKFVRDYDIPKKDDYSKDFFILASFSGNTEEILSCLEQVENVTDNFVVMSHG